MRFIFVGQHIAFNFLQQAAQELLAILLAGAHNGLAQRQTC
jgi:hypothetical protein